MKKISKIHASVENAQGGEGEFFINGQARLVEEHTTRQIAAGAASYDPAERYILFELSVSSAFSNIYQTDGPPLRSRWPSP